MNPFTWLKANLFEAAAMGMGVLLAVVVLIYSVKLGEKAHDLAVMTKERDTLHTAIYDEKSGWQHRLDVCHLNGAQLDQHLRDQNEQLRLASVESTQKMAAAETSLATARKNTQDAQTRIANLMQRLVAPDSCSRVYEMDRRLLDSLK